MEHAPLQGDGVLIPELVFGLSETIDLVHPALRDHQKRTAYVCLCLAREMGLPEESQHGMFLAGLLHDIGAVALRERLDLLEFESEFELAPIPPHAENGYRLLRTFAPLRKVARIVRFHHHHWDQRTLNHGHGEPPPAESDLLHVADRAALLLSSGEGPLHGKIPATVERLRAASGSLFDPRAVEAFCDLAQREFFWLEATDADLPCILRQTSPPAAGGADPETLSGLARLICTVIDCRSRYTATHSSGVAASAEALARLAGFDEGRARLMRVAGYLHDTGKLAVSDAILEKPGRLDEGEYFSVKSHSYYTHRVLSRVPSLAEAEPWASQHHERPNGTGYPFRLAEADLGLGARILAAADVFTALSEDRPYRQGIPDDEALKIIWEMARSGSLDAEVVRLLEGAVADVEQERVDAQRAAVEHFRGLRLTMPPQIG